MADVHDVEARHRNMSAIRGRNTKPEIIIRKLCHAQGFRFRLHRKDLPGKPDLVLPKYRAVIFVNGCFWHGHDCHLFRLPATNTGFWSEKIAGNQSRDQYQTAQLGDLGWRVLVIWECALKGRAKLEQGRMAIQLREWITGGNSFREIRGLQLDNRSADVAEDAA